MARGQIQRDRIFIPRLRLFGTGLPPKTHLHVTTPRRGKQWWMVDQPAHRDGLPAVPNILVGVGLASGVAALEELAGRHQVDHLDPSEIGDAMTAQIEEGASGYAG